MERRKRKIALVAGASAGIGRAADPRWEQSLLRRVAISRGSMETEFAEHFSKSAEVARQMCGGFQVLRDTDVAEAVLYTLGQPSHVQVHDVLMRPTEQL